MRLLSLFFRAGAEVGGCSLLARRSSGSWLQPSQACVAGGGYVAEALTEPALVGAGGLLTWMGKEGDEAARAWGVKEGLHLELSSGSPRCSGGSSRRSQALRVEGSRLLGLRV